VTALLIQTVSGMIVVSTTLMSIATVESEEEQAIEVTNQDLMEQLEATNEGLMDCLHVLMDQAQQQVDEEVLMACLHAQGVGPDPKEGGGR